MGSRLRSTIARWPQDRVTVSFESESESVVLDVVAGIAGAHVERDGRYVTFVRGRAKTGTLTQPKPTGPRFTPVSWWCRARLQRSGERWHEPHVVVETTP